jgi:pimeloyl-ACP methyl ester carboxylesterase
MAFMKHAGRPGLPKFAPIDDAVIASVSVPTYAIFGARSPIHHADDLAARLPALNARFTTEVVPRSGHTLVVEQPETVAALMMTFIHGQE